MFVRANNKFVKTNGYLKVFKEEPLIKSFIKTEVNEMTWFADEFQTYSTLEDTQIMLIIRHSERYNDGTKSLTENGKEYAKRIGQWLNWRKPYSLTSENCVFFSTNVEGNRTKDTALYLSESMFGTQQFVDDTKSSKFKIDYPIPSSGWPECASWSNNPSNEESQANVSKQIINGCYSLLGEKKFGVFVSHDYNTLPLTVWVTNHNLTFDFQGSKDKPELNEWLCYMAGILVIINNGIATMKPVYCIDAYLVNGQTVNITEGDNGYHGVMRDRDNCGYGNILHSNN